MTTQKRDFLVGLFVLVALGILAGAWMMTSGVGEERYELLMSTVSAEDLTQDTRVLLQGLTVGRVRAVDPVIDSASGAVHFVARLSVRARFPNGTELRLPRGTRAVIAKPNPVAASVVNLTIPADPQPGFVQPGETLPSSRPDDPLAQLGQIARQLDEQLGAVLTDVRQVLARSDDALRQSQALVHRTAPALDSTLRLMRTVLITSEDVLTVLGPKLGTMADSVVLAVGDSRRLMGRLDTLVGSTQSLLDDHRDTIEEIALALARSARILEHFADQVSRRPLRLFTGVRPPADSSP